MRPDDSDRLHQHVVAQASLVGHAFSGVLALECSHAILVSLLTLVEHADCPGVCRLLEVLGLVHELAQVVRSRLVSVLLELVSKLLNGFIEGLVIEDHVRQKDWFTLVRVRTVRQALYTVWHDRAPCSTWNS
jgi:hypothetical protein